MTGFTSIAQMLATPGATWAHRGGSANWPEMSEYAYAQAAAAGYGALEFSCGRSSDGVWFGLHNENIDEVSGVTGMPPASEMTWAEIQAYTINQHGMSEPFYRLDDFLDTYVDTHVVIVDHKHAWGYLGEWFMLLNEYDRRDKIVVKYSGVGSGAAGLANQARDNGYITWGYFYEADALGTALDTWQSYWDWLGMEYNASPAAWTAARSYGKPVVGHIAPSLAAYNTAITRGARMVQCSNVLGIPAVGAPVVEPEEPEEPVVYPETSVYVGTEMVIGMYMRGARIYAIAPDSMIED